jgi:putative ABC transport system substrate-binding protein
MDRRTFVSNLTLGALAAVPVGATAQPKRKVARIGLLNDGGVTSEMIGPQPKSAVTKALLGRLGELGYVYGEHFVTEPRGAESQPERYPALVAELVRLQVDVIVAGRRSLPSLKKATSTIPVVMGPSDDAVGRGFVQSLARPGGNFTGVSSQRLETTEKRLHLLKELAPSHTLIGVVWERADPLEWKAAKAAGMKGGWKLLSLGIQEVGELEGALRAATDARAGALLVMAPGLLIRHSSRVAELVARSMVPAMYDQRFFVNAGGLISYAPDTVEIWRHAADFVDKILKGRKPGDIPVEQPTKFELVVNLKAARGLGLTIPPAVLLRADHVIQ